jgi:phage terminase large subunit-like protein
MKRKIQKTDFSSKLIGDRATDYAQAVIDGDIIAGPDVRAACNRHINDLKCGPGRGLYFDKQEASEAIAFFEECLCLNGGQFEGKPFILLPWQCFVIGSIFGWKRKTDKKRRFRVAYVETAKGSGKSPLCAGTGIKGLVCDNEPRAEIYAAATFKDQAMVLFRDAIAFFDQSPELQSRLIASGTGSMRWNLAYLETGSFFRVISSEKKGQSGPRPHMALLDEIHEHRDGTVIEMLRAGFKFREQPLSFMITNSGNDKTSVGWEYHDMGLRIAHDILQDDAIFAFICSLDEADLVDDKYLDDESVWLKVNPSLDAGIPGYDYIRGQVREARAMDSKLATVKRLCFCQWTEAENPWISSDMWLRSKDTEYDESLLMGRRCVGGLDLSRVNDLTSLVLLFEPTIGDPFYRMKPFFWVPGVGLKQKDDEDHVPYTVWRDRGFIFAPPTKTIKKSYVIKHIQQVANNYDIQGIGYDRAMINDLFEAADEAGISLNEGKWDKEKKKWDFGGGDGIKIMPFSQKPISMHPAIEKFEGFLQNMELRHDGSPVMTWNISNAVVNELDDYRFLSKRLSTGRIDGVVAATIACGLIDAKGAPQESTYSTHGIFMID